MLFARYDDDVGSFGVSKFDPLKWGIKQLHDLKIDVDEDEFKPKKVCLVQ